jgi:hypothetical protein
MLVMMDIFLRELLPFTVKMTKLILMILQNATELIVVIYLIFLMELLIFLLILDLIV